QPKGSRHEADPTRCAPDRRCCIDAGDGGALPVSGDACRALAFRAGRPVANDDFNAHHVDGAVMNTSRTFTAFAAAAFLAGCASPPAPEAPRVDSSASTQDLKRLARKPGERVVVSIYEFRSSVSEITARGSTDIFITALMQSGRFRVV